MLQVIMTEEVRDGERCGLFRTMARAMDAIADLKHEPRPLLLWDRPMPVGEFPYAIVDRPPPTPAVAPRYFRVLTDGSTPSWTIIAARPCDAWRLWVDHEDASGFLDGEALGDGETLDPAGFAMDEISAEIAASRMVDDDGTRRPLTECAIGSVFCSEF